jgi:hypothetical protein
MDPITFAVLLTAAGAGIAAGLVTSAVSLIKTAIPLAKEWNGALMAFVISGALYVLAGVSTGVGTLDAGLNVAIAWLTCATAAVGIYEVATKPIVAKISE